MDNYTRNWLTEASNPAVAYRTQTELLGQTADKALVVKCPKMMRRKPCD
jgi:hypothetical protein